MTGHWRSVSTSPPAEVVKLVNCQFYQWNPERNCKKRKSRLQHISLILFSECSCWMVSNASFSLLFVTSATGWIFMTTSEHIHGPQRKNCDKWSYSSIFRSDVLCFLLDNCETNDIPVSPCCTLCLMLICKCWHANTLNLNDEYGTWCGTSKCLHCHCEHFTMLAFSSKHPCAYRTAESLFGCRLFIPVLLVI